MAVHQIKQGLDLPITGSPSEYVVEGARVSRVAVVAEDFPLMKPRMHVAVGDKVVRGQLLFEDRKAEGVKFTSPAEGEVVEVHRGERRVLQSVVIAVSEKDKQGQGEQVSFEGYIGSNVGDYSRDSLKSLLSESGLWTAFRARPYDRVPSPTEDCSSIFVTAMDTNPLAGSVPKALEGREEDFKRGLEGLALLTDGAVHLCKAPGAAIPEAGNAQVSEFGGLHPAGLPGTHIHFLDPVSRAKTVWHIGYQDVAAIGALIATGKLDVTRVVALGGPLVNEPRMLRTRQGASILELTSGELKDGTTPRLIAGSILNGRTANCSTWGYLGRYHNQVSVLKEDNERVLFGWLRAEKRQFSVTRAYISILAFVVAGLALMAAIVTNPPALESLKMAGGDVVETPISLSSLVSVLLVWGVLVVGLSMMRGAIGSKKSNGIDMTTTTFGSHRAMVPIGSFERVMPLDIMPTFLLRALDVDDIENAEALGCLELGEEDLALCSFVAPGKTDYCAALRRNLDIIWKEG